jgi:hypothetical protein
MRPEDVLKEVCSRIRAPEMTSFVIGNDVIVRETDKIIKRCAQTVSAPLMLNFVRIYNQTHPGKNLDPRNVSDVFTDVLQDNYM